MFAQLVTLKARSGSEAELLRRVNTWAQGPGKRLDGCNKVHVMNCLGDASRIALLIHFADKNGLARFSKDSDTLKMFADAKSLVESYADFMEASVSEHVL